MLAKGRIDFENVHYRDGNHPRPQLGLLPSGESKRRSSERVKALTRWP